MMLNERFLGGNPGEVHLAVYFSILSCFHLVAQNHQVRSLIDKEKFKLPGHTCMRRAICLPVEQFHKHCHTHMR